MCGCVCPGAGLPSVCFACVRPSGEHSCTCPQAIILRSTDADTDRPADLYKDRQTQLHTIHAQGHTDTLTRVHLKIVEMILQVQACNVHRRLVA